MKPKSLAAANRYLNQADADDRMAVNLASSTAVETEKPVEIYIERYRETHGDGAMAESRPESRQR